MARPRKIDREQLLDAAESLLAESGVGGLSFGGVAAAVGVPKASVQSAFGSREAMIEALLGRWLNAEEQRFNAAMILPKTFRNRVVAHIRTTGEEAVPASGRIASLMAALAGTGDQSASAARWYASRIGDLEVGTKEERRLRIAFLAAEGAFFVRYLFGFEMSDALWAAIFQDLERFALEGVIDEAAQG